MKSSKVWCSKCGSNCGFDSFEIFKCNCSKPDMYAWIPNSNSITDHLQSLNTMIVSETSSYQIALDKEIVYEFEEDSVDVK
jgi:hypothetical protein